MVCTLFATIEGKTKTQKGSEQGNCTSPTLGYPGDEIPIIYSNDQIIISNERNAMDSVDVQLFMRQFMRQSVEYFRGVLLQITNDIIEWGVTHWFAWEKNKKK